MSIQDAVLDHIQDAFQLALIDEIDPADPARAGVVQRGRLQDDIDPDEARISVTLHEGDLDAIRGVGTATGLSSSWNDEIIEMEIGAGSPVPTWARRFSVRARCLLEQTAETLDEAQAVASTVRKRIEDTLMHTRYTDVTEDGEYVCRPAYTLQGETIQSGGPDAYDFLIKVRFELWTTAGVT